ncbi:RagB/SusD family nutrient uptake outer membrane protein [Chitinophaga flava]|uniref:RagB/SusD family nutrient uptake outer membrane protein n=1 Tax=Chitinophaga flava TaxID=2259036 RepID=A0A365XUH8_9BACT|nr:RagB/SusD family nutrient uptake outer membrane protein [Chitinophaga flava]RBL89354.1 RagB/SusD family nutrient uptake outer membrane protein [Chitinophaga flava]
MKRNNHLTYLYLTIGVFSILGLTSCKKFLDVGTSPTSISSENVYQSDYTAAAVLTGLYAQMMNSDFNAGGITSISLLTELSADNLVLYDLTNLSYLAYYRNILDANNTNTKLFGNGDYFSNFYPRLYTINAAIEGLTKSTALTSTVKTRLLGEAFFLRALYYFYLVNLIGDTPLALTTPYQINSTLERSPVNTVYNQIASDLQQAISQLNENYIDGSILNTTTERVRPNKFAALALLARVELFRKNYSAAESAATTVINANNLYKILPLNEVFLKNSKETIWALQPVKTGYNTNEANVFLMPKGPDNNLKLFYASPLLINSFEVGDLRKSNWIGITIIGNITYPYIAKYKADVSTTASVTEYNVVFRLAEQYLIRAEARAEQNNIPGSISDINVIRQRAGLSISTANNINDLRLIISHERRVELFTEWGHRWLDLKRGGNIDTEMQKAELYKGGSWASYKALYPIPNDGILLNNKLVQNPGY